jgi:cobalt-zinc-cadmium efflux system outer membrane protein
MRLAAVFGTIALAGCAAQHYRAAPIVPANGATTLESRSLSDAGFRAYVEKETSHTFAEWPPKTWNLSLLSLAALYFNPAMDSARARIEEADAAVVTAGARPNPVLNISPGVPSPYLFSLDLEFPIETAGKRGHRVRSATESGQAARFDLAGQAWIVRSGVRAALLEYVLAERKYALLGAEEKLRTTQANLLQQRLTAGEIARSELDSAQIALSQSHLERVAAEDEIDQARGKLAASIGVPVSAMEGMQFSWSDLEAPPSEDSLTPEQIKRDAALNRMDVQQVLAHYAASEADLQLEIAKQYPDVQIGPGYTYEEKQNYFTLGLSVTLPIFNRNQGPIAEAEAKRKEAADAFIETQSKVIAQSEQALAAYTAASRELSESERSLQRTVQTQRERMVQQAARVGEEDQIVVTSVEIDGNALDQSRLEAIGRAQAALGELEDAVQRPLDASDSFPTTRALIEPTASAPNAAPKESEQ